MPRCAWLCSAYLQACAAAPTARGPEPELGSPRAGQLAPGSSNAAEAPSSPAPSGEPASGPQGSSSGEIDLDGDDLDKDIEELSKATQVGGDAPDGGLQGREIVYRVTPQGLVIELDGLHLRPSAKLVRETGGTYGVALTLTAESFDQRQYWLRHPDAGPLSIAGKVEDESGKGQRFADERRGEGEDVVTAGAPREFKQRWPGRGQPKLRAGQTVTLEVGLWGVRAESDRERPVRRLFVVKMLGSRSAQPVLTPPTLDWGS